MVILHFFEDCRDFQRHQPGSLFTEVHANRPQPFFNRLWTSLIRLLSPLL